MMMMMMTMMMMVVTICHMMAPEEMMIAMLYAIGVYHREGEEGGGRTKYILTAVGLSIILPVLDRWLVDWLWVGCYDDGALLTLIEVDIIIYDTGECILARWITTTTRFVCRLRVRM